MTVRRIATIQRFVGLAADDKPTGVPVGSRFHAANTPAEFINGGGELATVELTIAAQPEVADTILLGITTYTFVADVDFNAADEIGIGADDAEAITNIAAAINGTDGVNTANADVEAADQGDGTILVTAREPGTAANSLASVYANAGLGTNAFAAVTLLGGIEEWLALP